MSATQGIYCAPWSADRWVVCNGSVGLEAMFPETETDPKRAEGRASHWALSELLRDSPVAEGQVAENDAVLNAEMIDGAEMGADYIQGIRGSTAVAIHVEERVDVSTWNWGRPDAWFSLHDSTTGILTIHVFEYKYGQRYVDVYRRRQLVNYAKGVLLKLQVPAEAYHHVRFVLHIIQPRAFHRDGPCRSWRVAATELVPMFSEIAQAVDAIQRPGALCVPTRSGCMDCRGRTKCEANARVAGDFKEYASTSLPLEMPADALAAELRRVNAAIDILKARQSGLEADAMHKIKQGQRVPGWDLQPTSGRERWDVPAVKVIAYGQMMGIDVAKPPEAITPAQARKKGMDPAQVARLAVRPAGALQLVEDDGRVTSQAFGGQT